MNKTIAVQLNNTNEKDLIADREAILKLGLDPIWYGLIPFSDEVICADAFDKYDLVVPFGTVKLIRLWQRGLLPKSARLFYDEARFDQRTYQEALGEDLLNGYAEFTTLGQVKDRAMRRPTFIKPTRDLKAFAGCIVEAGQTPGSEIFSRPQDTSLTDDEPVLLAPLRYISKEYRNFVVDGKLIDSSIYKIRDTVVYQKPTESERRELASFQKYIAAKYEPIGTYVVDFARVEPSGMLVVIEFNCFNCAGMYATDRAAIFNAALEAGSK